MSPMPKVSVIITTYNRPEFLDAAVASVKLQTFKDWELLIMDDNSDVLAQRELLAEFRQEDKIRVFDSNVQPEDRKKTTRYATLINWALKEAKGEYVTYLCDDDFYFPDRLQKMVEFLDSRPDVSVCFGPQKLMQKNADGTLTDFPTSIRDNGEIISQANCQVDHSSVMMRKSLVDDPNVGYWDDDPGWWGSADGVYWEKLNKAGYSFYRVGTEPLDCHVYHDGSWTKDGRWEKEL